MSDFYTKEELTEIGFEAVGENVNVSKDARFYSVRGKIGNNSRIDAFTVITGNIDIQEDVHISPFCFLGGTGGRITFMNNSGISSHVSLFTKSDNYKNDNTNEIEKLVGDITLGKNSIVGSGSRILPGVIIHDNVSVGANSVINKDIEPGSVVVSRSIGVMTVLKR
jgi:acetyltransferase-like isoleucine patch superfamily enzyme